MESGNQQQLAGPNASSSFIPALEIQGERPSSPSIKRARSMIRHRLKELKPAGNAYPAPSAHILSLGDTLRQETEQVLKVHNHGNETESRVSFALGTPAKVTSSEPEYNAFYHTEKSENVYPSANSKDIGLESENNSAIMRAERSENLYPITTEKKMGIATENYAISYTDRSENMRPVTNNKKLSIEAENNAILQAETSENIYQFTNDRKMNIDLENDAILQAERSENMYPMTNNKKRSLEPEQHFLFRIDKAESINSIVEQNTESIKVMESRPTKDTLDLTRTNSLSSDYIMYNSRKQSNFVYASCAAIPINIRNVCILSHGGEISHNKVQTTANNILIARLDRMSPNEQLILKCASILGMNFTRELLSAIVPRKTASVLDNTLYKLSKERLIECGSFALSQSQQHMKNNNENSKDNIELNGKTSYNIQMQDPKNQVLCGCYANDGSPTINLSHIVRQAGGKKKLCLYFHFTDTMIRETAYDLWLEDQRHALHERAAIFLENQTHLCKSCGGSSFVPGKKFKTGYKRNSSIRELGRIIKYVMVFLCARELKSI